MNEDRPDWFTRELVSPVSPAEEHVVRVAQLILRVPETGVMDVATKSSIRGIQRLFNLPATGSLDLDTAKAIDSLRWVDHSIQESGTAP